MIFSTGYLLNSGGNTRTKKLSVGLKNTITVQLKSPPQIHLVSIELNKKDYKLDIETSDDMKMRQLIDVLINRAHKQGISPEAFDMTKEPYPSGKVVKQEVSVRNGLKQDDSKKIIKLIKDSGTKVQAQIMDDLVRVTGKKIDDLQAVIKLCQDSSLGIPLQFINMRS